MINDITPQYKLHHTIGELSLDLNRLFTAVRTIQHATGGHTHDGTGNEGPILGAGAIDWPLLAPAGTVLQPSYGWADEVTGGRSGSGFYRIANNNIGLAINGTKLWDFSAASASLTGTLSLSVPLPIASGGTNKALTLAAGGIIWSDADSFEVSAAGTTNAFLKSGGTGAPVWSGVICDSSNNLSGIGTVSCGAITGGLYNGQTISDAASFTGSITAATVISVVNASVDPYMVLNGAATGNPYISWQQNSVQKAAIQWLNATSLLTISGATNFTSAMTLASTLSVGTTAQTGTANRFRQLQSMARVTMVGDYTLTSGVTAQLPWDAETYDTDTLHDNSTNNSRLTAAIAGKYRVSATVEFSSNATGVLVISLQKNGATTSECTQLANNSVRNTLVATDLVSLTAGQYMEVQAYSTGGLTVASARSSFSMEYVGE